MPLILIVDDDPIARKLLNALLTKEKYRVMECEGGGEGIRVAVEKQPDLILLDVMMPEVDGFEVMARLKSDERTTEIPVIFLSAKADSTDKVRGLGLGAADFINKPFDRAELLARISTQIKLKKQEERLKEYSHNLEQMVEERTRQLIHADRLASLGTLSAGIAHEINNPTTFITGNLQTLESFWKKISELLETHHMRQEDPKIEYIIREFPDMIQSIRVGADRIANIVSGLKAFARDDTSAKSRTDLVKCIDEALKLTHNRLKYYINVEKDVPSDLPMVWANEQQLIQVFVNLAVNAADSIGDRKGLIRIRAEQVDGQTVKIWFNDNGHGISPQVIQKVFDPFFTTKPVGKGTGLGLSITHGIVRDHNGTIEVESVPEKGTTFMITLPTEPI